MTPVRSAIRSTSRRQIALVVLALLLAVLFAYPGSGLLLEWSSTEDAGIHRFHTVVWGVHTGLVLSAGLVALLLRTEQRVATAQQVGVAMAVMMTVFFGSVVIPQFGEPEVGIDRVVFSIMVLALTGLVLALRPRRGELLTTGRSISKPMAALGVIGLAVAAAYTLDQIQVQLATDLATDPHSAGGREHRAEMASAALTLPLTALVAALRTRVSTGRVDRRDRHGGLRRCLGLAARAGIQSRCRLGRGRGGRRGPAHSGREYRSQARGRHRRTSLNPGAITRLTFHPRVTSAHPRYGA